MRTGIEFRPVWLRLAAVAATIALLITVVPNLSALALLQDDVETQPLRGVFTVTITRTDIPSGLAGGPSLTGLWNITFDADGTFSLARQDVGAIVRGTFEAGDATLSFNEWTGIVGCDISADGEPATYAWQQSDDTLTLTPISDSCTERLTLLTTRSLGGFEACVVSARSVTDPFATDIPMATPVAAPTAPVSGVAAQEGLSEGADAEEAIDSLLRQANGCWATGDPTRFMALHGLGVIDEISFIGPCDEFARQLRLLMSTPVSFERIGPVNLIDADHAWAYVEVTLGGDPLPQRVDFVFEDGAWLFDTFFLFGPPTPTGPVEVEPVAPVEGEPTAIPGDEQ